MRLDDLTAGQEHFWGWFARNLADNKYYVVAGHNHASVLEVTGLERFKRMSGELQITAADLLTVPEGPKTEAGLRQNVAVGIGYLEAWLRGDPIKRGEVRELPAEIRRYEPVHTLTDRSVDGLGLVTRAVEESHEWLKRGGWFLVEVSPDRARAVASVMRRGGLRDVVSTKGGDLKVTRVICGRR